MSYTILADKSLDEAAWLAARRKVVTASESAHLMNCAPSFWAKSEEELAKQKLSGKAITVSPAMAAGSFWEGPILDYFGEATSLSLIPSSVLYGSDKYPWMGATPDAFVEGPPAAQVSLLSAFLTVQVGMDLLTGKEALEAVWGLVRGGRVLVEVKNQPSKARSKWNKESGGPAYYENQVHHQLAVVDDCHAGLLVAKVDANELYCHVVHRDELYIELLAETCGEFAKKYLDATE